MGAQIQTRRTTDRRGTECCVESAVKWAWLGTSHLDAPRFERDGVPARQQAFLRVVGELGRIYLGDNGANSRASKQWPGDKGAGAIDILLTEVTCQMASHLENHPSCLLTHLFTWFRLSPGMRSTSKISFGCSSDRRAAEASAVSIGRG